MGAYSSIRNFTQQMADPVRRLTEESLSFSVGRNYGVPHTFNPDLRLGEAVLAAIVAFSRIFLGSLLFAMWGVGAWLTYAALGNPVLRFLALVPIAILFLISMATLMIAISRLVNWLHRKLTPAAI